MIAVAVGAVLGIGLFSILLGAGPRSTTGRGARRRHADAWLQRRGLSGNVGAIGAATIGSVLVVGVVGTTARLPAAVMVLGVVLATVGPMFLLELRARSRHTALERHWPDVVDHLVAELRSGAVLPNAVSSLPSRVHPVLRPAFRDCDDEWRTTGDFDLALDRLKSACADATADRLVEVIRLSHEVGGRETVELLRQHAASLRDERALREEVRSRRTWVVNTARLGVAAPWVVLLLLCSRPEAASAYNTPAGVAVLVAGFAASLLAYRLVAVLGRSTPEKRWMA